MPWQDAPIVEMPTQPSWHVAPVISAAEAGLQPDDQSLKGFAFADQAAERLATAPFSIGFDAVASLTPPEYREQVVQRYRQNLKAGEGGGKKLKETPGATTAFNLVEGAMDFAAPIARYVGGIPRLDPEQERFKQQLQAIQQGEDPTVPEGFFARGAQSAARSAAPMVNAIAAGKMLGATGLPGGERVGVAASFYPQISEQTYAELIGEGVDPDTATIITRVSAPVEAAVESILPDPVSPRGAAIRGGIRSFVRSVVIPYVKRQGVEIGEEALQGMVRETAMEAARLADEDMPNQGIGSILRKGLESGVESIVPVGLIGAPGAAIQTTQELQGRRERYLRYQQLKEIRAKGYVSAEDGQAAGIEGATRKERLQNADAEIQQIEQEIQNAPDVRSDETEVRQDQSGPDVRGSGQEQVRPEQAGAGAAAPEVQVEEPRWIEVRSSAEQPTGWLMQTKGKELWNPETGESKDFDINIEALRYAEANPVLEFTPDSATKAWVQSHDDPGFIQRRQSLVDFTRRLTKRLSGWNTADALTVKDRQGRRDVRRTADTLKELRATGHIQVAWDRTGTPHYAWGNEAIPAWLTQSQDDVSMASLPPAPTQEPPADLARRAARGEAVERPEGVSEPRWSAMIKQQAKRMGIKPRTPVKPKESWQMTWPEYIKDVKTREDYSLRDTKRWKRYHQYLVSDAAAEGKPVPAEVLAEYQNLPPQKPARPAADAFELDDLPPPKPPTTPIPSVGDNLRLLNVDSTLADVQEVEGVRYELYNDASLKGKGGTVRIFDVDSGKAADIRRFPSYDAAEAYQKKAIHSATATTPQAAPQQEQAPAAAPTVETREKGVEGLETGVSAISEEATPAAETAESEGRSPDMPLDAWNGKEIQAELQRRGIELQGNVTRQREQLREAMAGDSRAVVSEPAEPRVEAAQPVEAVVPESPKKRGRKEQSKKEKPVEPGPQPAAGPVEFSEQSKGVNAPGVKRTFRATSGDRTIVIEQSKQTGVWSIKEPGRYTGKVTGKPPVKAEDKPLASGIFDLRKAKDVAQRIIAGTFDPQADVRFEKEDTKNAGFTNAQIGKEIKTSGLRRDSYARLLKESNWATDGRLMLKVTDKDRDAISSKIGETGEGSPMGKTIESVISEAKEAFRRSGNAMAPIAYRGGDIAPRTVVLKSTEGDFAELDKSLHDTVLKKYPDATPYFAGKEQPVAYEIGGEPVAIVMPMRLKEDDAAMQQLVAGTYSFTETAAEPTEPAPEPPKRRIGAKKKTPGKPIAEAAIQETFPGAKTTKAPGGWHVEVGDSFFTIQTTDKMPEIDWDSAQAAIGRTITAKEREQIQAAGATSLEFPDGTKHDGLGLILLNESLADDKVLRHEALHLARQAGIIGKAEWDALVKAHAKGATDENVQEERIAQAMEAVETETRLWSRIQSWIRRLLAKLGITDYQARDVHQLLRSSGFWARAGYPRRDGTRYSMAWHGSPHQFDKFTTERIGSGEGAQAYGWGLYFADSEDVGKHYREKLSRENVLSENDLKDYFKPGREIPSYGGGKDTVVEFSWNDGNWNVKVKGSDGFLRSHHTMPDYKQFEKVMGRKPDIGALYQVDLAPEQDEYLLWDRPLSEQSEKVKAAIKSIAPGDTADDLRNKALAAAAGESTGPYSRDGEWLYRNLAAARGASESRADQWASKYLRSIGIRGIKFLDQASRFAPAGQMRYRVRWDSTKTKPEVYDIKTSQVVDQKFDTFADADDWIATQENDADRSYNYVIFDEADVSIKARYALRGRPDLANPATDEEARRLVDDVDEARNDRGLPERRADEDVEREADDRLASDYAGERDKLVRAGRNGEQLLDTDTIIAKKIINREASEAMQSGERRRIAEAMAIIEAYRNTGSEQGRAFRQRRDPVETPAERMARAISEAILEPPQKQREKRNRLRREGKHDEADRINENWAKEFEALKERLKALGVDIDNLWEHGYSRKRAASVLATITHAKASPWDKAYEYWRNSILSLPTTQTANVFGNVGHAGWHFTAERFTEAMVNTVAQRPEAAQLGEFKHMLAGMLPGMSEGARNFLTTWNTEMPTFEARIGREGQWRIEDPNTAIGGKAGRVIRWPQRLLLAVDDFSKTMFTRMEVGVHAYRIAKAEGLQGEEMANRMHELTLDEESPAWDKAYDSALELTFQQKGGETLRKIKRNVLSARRDLPGLRYILPFVTTPTNIFATGIKKSPLGTLGIPMKMYRNYQSELPIMQGVPADIAQQVLAWGLVLALLGNDDDDPWITGSEPESTFEKREVGYRSAPAMSVKIGGSWYAYSRLEPFATAIGLTVDFVNALRSGDTKRQVETPLATLKGQLGGKTFLSGVGDILDAVQEEETSKGLARWTSNFATSWVPNVVRGSGREASDYYENRRVWGTRGEWFARLGKRTIQKTELPAFQEYPIYDVWGRPATRSETGLGAATDWLYRITIPIRVQKDETFSADRLILNYNNQNPEDERFPLAPRPYYTDGGKTVYMTDGQYAELAKLTGEAARAAIDETQFDVENPTLEAVEWVNDATSESRSAIRDRLKEKWGGGESEIDPEAIGAEIRDNMRQSLVGNIPTDKDSQDDRAKIKRTLDVLGISKAEAIDLLRAYYKQRYGHTTPSYAAKKKALANLYAD